MLMKIRNAYRLYAHRHCQREIVDQGQDGNYYEEFYKCLLHDIIFFERFKLL